MTPRTENIYPVWATPVQEGDLATKEVDRLWEMETGSATL